MTNAFKKNLLEIGAGHTSYEVAINNANKAQVKKLVIFHHDPTRSDKALDTLEKTYQEMIVGITNMELIFAREQMTIEV